MTAEQEAIERLRTTLENHEKGLRIHTIDQADLRTLLDSHERMRLAIQRVCEQGLVEEAGLWLLDLALEGNQTSDTMRSNVEMAIGKIEKAIPFVSGAYPINQGRVFTGEHRLNEALGLLRAALEGNNE